MKIEYKDFEEYQRNHSKYEKKNKIDIIRNKP